MRTEEGRVECAKVLPLRVDGAKTRVVSTVGSHSLAEALKTGLSLRLSGGDSISEEESLSEVSSSICIPAIAFFVPGRRMNVS